MSKTQYGLTSFSEGVTRFNNQNSEQNGPRVPFLKLKEGNNVLRIITNPYKYCMVRFKASADEKGFGKRINCSLPLAECPTKKAGFKPKDRWLVGVIDRSDSQVKIYDFSVLVYEPLNSLSEDIEWGDPIGYDITVRKNSKAGPAQFYSVMPRGKAALSPADLKLKEEFGDNLEKALARLTTPPSAETVLKRMQEAGYTGGVVAQPQTNGSGKPELSDMDDDDYSFNRPAAQA
jgi:hypothetical protein